MKVLVVVAVVGNDGTVAEQGVQSYHGRPAGTKALHCVLHRDHSLSSPSLQGRGVLRGGGFEPRTRGERQGLTPCPSDGCYVQYTWLGQPLLSLE